MGTKRNTGDLDFGRGSARSLLVPDWPPQTAAEALLLVLCAVALRLLLDLWLPVEQAIPLFNEPADQARVLLGEALRFIVVALMFGLAARLILQIGPTAALGTGAGVLLAFATEPLLGRFDPGLGFNELIAAQALAAALFALVIGALLSRRLAPSLGFAIVVGLITVGSMTYMQRHAWILDAVGMAVKGALIADRDEARRTFLLHLPPLVVICILWLLLGGSEARKLWYTVKREWPWPIFGFIALVIAGGWMAAARAESLSLGAWLPSLFLPPAIYGLFAVILSLALVIAVAAAIQGRLRQRAHIVARGHLFAMTLIAVVLALAISPDVLIAIACFAATLLVLIWPMGQSRPPMMLELVAGGALTATAFCAGALALPEFEIDRFADMAMLIATVAAAGVALAGLARVVDEVAGNRPASSRRPRIIAAMWCLDLGAAIVGATLLMGLASPLLWTVIAAGGIGFFALLMLDRGFKRGPQFFILLLAWSAASVLMAAGLLLGRY
ncbi:MAG: hypothetical protein GDA49_08665 [Rhodospirillales bacterium]|nr:hypothetical protein [Rhodospirillales bacterium]